LLLQARELAWEREKLLMEQRVQLASQNLSQGADGAPVNPMAAAMQIMMQQFQQALMASNRPKRVVRDDAGEIVGLEPYDAQVMQ
jgi:hypothetical protein